MQDTFQALGHLILKSVPTIFFFVVLTLYLKQVFFKPMRKILDERKRATEGVRELARKAFEAADKKSSEFEEALRIARAELYREREALRRRWAEEQVEQVAKARAEADAKIAEAKRQIEAEVRRADTELQARAQELSENIVNALLTRRAA
jgi:F-type H+-transporting ATPase subunit b